MSPDWFLALVQDPGEGVGCQRVTPFQEGTIPWATLAKQGPQNLGRHQELGCL